MQTGITIRIKQEAAIAGSSSDETRNKFYYFIQA